jgi:hypothetical protein
MAKREPYTTTRYVVHQIMPAPAGAIAVYAEGEEAFGDEIMAWGVFDEIEEHFGADGRKLKEETTRVVGPLVMGEACTLEPPWTSSNFAGVRIGERTWVRLGQSPAIPEPPNSPFIRKPSA